MCWENRGLGSPAGPGLSMVVPVNWMVSRKIWINWSCEMVWPDALGIIGMPCGSRYWAGNLLSILSRCLFIAWCGQMRWKCRADWQMQECPRATKHRLNLFSGLVESGMLSFLWLLSGARRVMLLLLPLRCL